MIGHLFHTILYTDQISPCCFRWYKH